MNKMMNPEMEVVRFEAEDIMTASNNVGALQEVTTAIQVKDGKYRRMEQVSPDGVRQAWDKWAVTHEWSDLRVEGSYIYAGTTQLYNETTYGDGLISGETNGFYYQPGYGDSYIRAEGSFQLMAVHCSH